LDENGVITRNKVGLVAKGHVIYGDNNKSAILGEVGVDNPSTTTILNVFLVERSKHNLSISQLCDKEYKFTFTKLGCMIEHNDKKDLMFKGRGKGPQKSGGKGRRTYIELGEAKATHLPPIAQVRMKK
jgi:hypothetical protein